MRQNNNTSLVRSEGSTFIDAYEGLEVEHLINEFENFNDDLKLKLQLNFEANLQDEDLFAKINDKQHHPSGMQYQVESLVEMMRKFSQSPGFELSGPCSCSLTREVRGAINRDLNVVMGSLRSIMQAQSLTWKVADGSIATDQNYDVEKGYRAIHEN